MQPILTAFLFGVALATAPQQCYFGPGAENRGPENLVPCNGTAHSTCCLLGDTCLSGNACYNFATGDLYQYGCTDINYQDATCPYKCGWDPALSPWTALEYCNDLPQVDDTWACHAPETCGCQWNSTYDLLVLEARGCSAMGSDARVAIWAPSTLAPYVSLPSTYSGSTGYYSQTTVSGTPTWVSTAIAGYTPANFTQFTTYRAAPTSAVIIDPGVTPAPSTYAAAKSYSSTPSQSLGNAASSSVSASYTTTTTSSTSTSSTTVSSATSSSTTPTPTPAPDNGLSTGAKIGIGVGVGGGVLLLLAVAAAAFLWGRHKNNRAANQQNAGHGHHPSQIGSPYYPQSPPMGQAAPPYQQQPSHWGQQQYFEDQHYHHHGSGGEVVPEFAAAKKQTVSPPVELSTDADRRAHEIGSGEVRHASPSVSSVPSPRPGERGHDGGMF